MVALVTEEHADTFISSLKQKFYASMVTKNVECDEFIFSSLPCNGAIIFK